jgi:protein-tyrosine kinase
MPNVRQLIKRIIATYTPPIYVVRKPKTKEGIDGHFVAYVDKSSFVAEQYKVIRTNLYALSPHTPFKSLVITSSQSQEGKTITSCNLSYTFSLDPEKKVLLLDADFRKPTVHRLLAIPRRPGFTDILSDKVDLEYFTKKPAIGNLHVIPSGTLISNPSELISSQKMKEFIEKIKAQFDYVIFDSPPVINVTDSCILGSICDCVILVVKAGITPKNMVEEAFTMLTHAQAKPKASIMTGTSVPVYYYYLSRYRYYYKYRYGYRRDQPTAR